MSVRPNGCARAVIGIRRARLGWLVLVGLLSSRGARAEDFVPDLLLPAPDQSGFLTIPSTRTPGPWGMDASLASGYRHQDASAGGGAAFSTHSLDGTLITQLGLGGRTALALRLPFTWVQRVDVPSASNATTSGLGNPALEGRVRIYGAPVRPDGSARDGAAVALRGIVHLPVNADAGFYADDKTRAELSAITDVEAFGLGAAALLAYRHRFEADPWRDNSLASSLRLSLGLKVPLPLIALAVPGKVIETALLELNTGTNPAAPFEKATTPVEALLSYRIGVGDIWLSLGGGTSLTRHAAAPDARVVFNLTYSPRVHDQDADGVPDSDDHCEHLAEDHDAFEDQDGCPEPDNDQDMILDEDDRCPQEAAEIDRDQDEDGCTDP